jgi:hypothetical protein
MSDITLDFTVSNNQANFIVTPNDLAVTINPVNLTFSAGGLAVANGVTGAVQYNKNSVLTGNSTFTFDDTTGIVSVPTLQASNAAYLPDVSNVRILGGTNGYVLQTDGIGNLSWTAQTGGGGGNGSPGGANTQIQYNNSGAFGGNALFTFNSVTGNVNIPGNLNVTGNISGNIGAVANANYSNFAGTAYSISGSNVSGTVANANYSTYAGTVLTNAQPNITSIGTLGNLVVSGNITANGTITSNNTITGTQLISTTSGIPPLVVNSSLLVANLYSGRANVSYYLNLSGSVFSGYLPYISGVTSANAQMAGSLVKVTGTDKDALELNFITTLATTYSNLPVTPYRVAGSRAIITNANTTTFNSLVSGGGSNVIPIFYDGTNWRVG